MAMAGDEAMHQTLGRLADFVGRAQVKAVSNRARRSPSRSTGSPARSDAAEAGPGWGRPQRLGRACSVRENRGYALGFGNGRR
jgi:hypothetical protein